MTRAGDTAVGLKTPIIGRRTQLEALAEALTRLEDRGSPIVAISGEPGIGKTRLLDELCARADGRGHLVLSGRAAEMEQDLPFAVVVDALGDYAASLGSDRLERLIGAQAEELAPVVPGVEGLGGVGASRLQDERFRSHRAVRALLEALGASGRVVFALDDVHWADDASLELIGHLLRRPPRRGVMLVLAFRPAPARPALVDALAGATRDGAVIWLSLGALTRAEADRLLDDDVPDPARGALFAQSGGNPFYLLELARGSASRTGGAAADVPSRVALAIDQELRALPDHAQRLARAAAVVGDPMALDVAMAAGELEEGPALSALDALLGSALLAPTDVPRRYRFRHPLVRRAVYDTTPGGWRLGAHARAARALEDQGGSLTARAHHLERCAQPGDKAAIEVLVAAGATAAPRAPATAAAWYAAALRLLPESVETAGQRLGLLVAQAQSQAATGELMPALEALTAALDLAAADDGFAPLRARLVAGCAMCENLLGRHDAAHRRLVAALDDVTDPRSAAAADLEVQLAADALYDGDFATMLTWARRGLDAAITLAEPALAVLAESLVCYAELGTGRIPEALAAASTASAGLDALSDDAIALRLEGPYYLGFAEYFAERYEDAIRHWRRGIAVSRASGQGQFATPMSIGLAHAFEVIGRPRAGLDQVEAAVEAARLSGNRQVLCWALTAEAWIAAIAGELPRARAAGAAAVDLLGDLDESVLSRATRVHVAAAQLEAGEPERCVEAMADAGGPEFVHVEPGRRAWLYAILARAELDLGHEVVAEDWVARGESLARTLGLGYVEGAVAHAGAMLELARGNARGALEQAERAVTRAADAGAAVQASRARIVAGRAAAAAGDVEGAVAWLERAESELAAMGAVRFRDEAARELRRLGRRVGARRRRASGGSGLASLSGREREIAELVARGHTNREIAAELFLSEKTIESHLRKVFAKLGVSGRVGVAEAVGRERDPED
ncbi:MAG: AAA family ATPase [Solirubrobacterales bacterium]|nr:AAA family ATPase [Solirubrobacterales bacterium]